MWAAKNGITDRSVHSVNPEHVDLAMNVSRKVCSRAAAEVLRLTLCWFISAL